MRFRFMKWTLGAALFFSVHLYGQRSGYDYRATVEWMKTTFEQNDLLN